MTQVTLNGHVYSDDGSAARDMQGGGVRNWLLPMMSDAAVEIGLAKAAQTYANDAATSAADAANYAAALNATYAGSLTIAAGSQSFTVQAGKQFAAGQYVMIIRSADPAYYMWGTVTSYNAGSGALAINAIATAGTGSYSGWSVSLSGVIGPQGTPPRAYLRSQSSSYTAVLGDMACIIDCTGTWTLSLTAAATLGDGYYVWVRNAGSGAITIDPAGAETIDGAATVTLPAGHYCLLQCDGAAWKTTIAGLTGLRKLPVLSDTSGKAALSSGELIDSLVSTGIGNTVGPIIWTGSLFVAASSNSAASCATSPTGQTWTLRSLPASMSIYCMASIGSTVVLIQTGTTAAARSTDGGVTWSSMTLPVATSSPSIGVVGGLFVLAHTTASGTAYYTSPDGSTWTSRAFPATGNWAVSVETCNGLLFATATVSASTTYYTTPDGINWTSRTLPAAGGSGRFHTSGKRQADGSYAYMSTAGPYSTTDGINWAVLSTTVPSTIYSPLKFRGTWIVIGSAATTYTTGNVAGAWTPRAVLAGNFCYSEGKYAADHAGGNVVSYTGASNGNVQTINTSTPVVYGLFGD